MRHLLARWLRGLANGIDSEYRQAKRAYLAGIAANPNARPTPAQPVSKIINVPENKEEEV
jgi:vacuolar-type H+-ATPase subunit B/Vma2